MTVVGAGVNTMPDCTIVGVPDPTGTSNWYQFDVPVGSGTPTIVQSGIVFTPAPTTVIGTARYYFVPSITVSGQGHAAMGFSAADSVERINCATVGRLASDPL